MNPIATICGRAYPFGRRDVDTDLIIPAVYMKTIDRSGLGKRAFEAVRRQAGNIFDAPAFAGSPILLAGENFGCGSSREHAVWALKDLGVRVVIAPSFSDIFAGNAFKNGILTVELGQNVLDRLMQLCSAGEEISVDLEALGVTTGHGETFDFRIDPFRRECLLKGTDEIALTLAMSDQIAQHEHAALAREPWLAAGLAVRAGGEGGRQSRSI